MLGNIGDDVSKVPVAYPHGTVSFSLLGYFSSVGSSSKPSYPSLPISVGAPILMNIPRRRGGGNEN